MLNKIFGKSRIQNYCVKLEGYIPGSCFDEKTSSLSIPYGKKNITISFKDIIDMGEAKRYFSKTMYSFSRELDLFEKKEIISWYESIPSDLKDRYYPEVHTYSWEKSIIDNERCMSFLEQIKDVFNAKKIYFSDIASFAAGNLVIETPFFCKDYELYVNISEKTSLNYQRFENQIVRDLANKCVCFNKEGSLEFDSTERLRDSFEKMLKMNISEDSKKYIWQAIKQLPCTKEDYIAIYKELVEEEKKECFEENVYQFSESIMEIKNGDFKEKFSIKDIVEFGRLIESLSKMNYNKLSQKDKNDYEKAKHIAYLMEYVPDEFEESEDEITFPDNKTAIIGEYFYIEDQGAIIPNFDKFSNLPQEFFDMIEKIKERGTWERDM